MLIYTQRLAGSPANAQSPLFEEQETKDAINDAYVYFMEIARSRGVGFGQKRSYADTVVDQLYYELPDDFIRAILVELDTDGNDLSTTDPDSTSILIPKFEAASEVLEMYERNLLGEAQYYSYHGGETQGTDHLLIAGPMETGGTNSLRLSYEASVDELSGDTDEPILPRNFHQTICWQAAYILRLQNDLPTRSMKQELDKREIRFQRTIGKVGKNVDMQIPLDKDTTNYATNSGFVKNARRR
jgi:hypothetical protein